MMYCYWGAELLRRRQSAVIVRKWRDLQDRKTGNAGDLCYAARVCGLIVANNRRRSVDDRRRPEWAAVVEGLAFGGRELRDGQRHI